MSHDRVGRDLSVTPHEISGGNDTCPNYLKKKKKHFVSSHMINSGSMIFLRDKSYYV